MSRVFIIGWDGATFDLIHPWVAQGKLPNIAKLMQKGTHGFLRSTVPPMTFPAWTSFMTGKNQGKHGIYDFTRRLAGKYQLEFVNGGLRREATFWRILGDAGRKVIAISIPCTFPPEKVNGIMISGFDSPGADHVDARGMYPPELHAELEKAGIHHPINAPIAVEINQGRPDLALQQTVLTVQQKAATAKYLVRNKPWDCFMVLFGESDPSGHYFWKYCDPNSPLFVDHPAKIRDAILTVYQELDRQAGELLALVPDDATILMMSDHGFGGVSNCLLYPNCWLRDQGFLRFKGRASRRFARVLDALKLQAMSIIPNRLKRALMGRLNRYGPAGLESYVRYGMIDWDGTEAYFDENPYYPMLWINLKGRQPKGIVEPGLHYEETRDRLIRALESWRHPDTGERVVEKAYRREDLYSGPAIEDAPDIIAKWALHQGYNYAFKLSAKSPDLKWLETVDPNKPEHLPYFTGKSGHHRDLGIFVGQGKGIKENFTLEGARIIDLAPTILYLLGVPIPNDMDGRVLEEIFADDRTRQVPVQTAAASTVDTSNGSNGGYTAEDEEKISDRLKSLGYID